MEAKVSPTLRRRRLGRKIREHRSALKLSGDALAKLIGGINQSRLSKVEIGKAGLTQVQLRKVIEILKPSAAEAKEWHKLWQEGDQLGWWSEFLDVLNEHEEMLTGFEADAAHIRQYIDAYLPSLLATEAYTRAVVGASQRTRPADVLRVVEFRQRRQRQRLTDPAFRLTAVIDEGALYRQVGGKDVHAESLRYLLDAPWEATVEIMVVPFESGAYGAQGMSFQVMQFPDPEDLEAVFVESGPGSGFLEKPSEVRYYNQLFSVAEAAALDVADSRKRIEAILARASE